MRCGKVECHTAVLVSCVVWCAELSCMPLECYEISQHTFTQPHPTANQVTSYSTASAGCDRGPSVPPATDEISTCLSQVGTWHSITGSILLIPKTTMPRTRILFGRIVGRRVNPRCHNKREGVQRDDFLWIRIAEGEGHRHGLVCLVLQLQMLPYLDCSAVMRMLASSA